MTHCDDVVLTGPTKKSIEFERKMTNVIGYGSPKNIKTLNRRLYWGKRGIFASTLSQKR